MPSPNNTCAARAMLFKRPSSVQDLWGLREQATRAAETLGKFLPQVIEALVPKGE